MTLEELLWSVNDSTVISLYSAKSGELIETYDGKDSLSGNYEDCSVTDIFVENNKLCIEIDA